MTKQRKELTNEQHAVRHDRERGEEAYCPDAPEASSTELAASAGQPLPLPVTGSSDTPEADASRQGGESPPPTGSVEATVPGSNPDRFLSTTYRDGAFTKTPVTLAGMLCLDCDIDVDAYINEVTGRIVIQPQSGPPLRYRGAIPGVGPDVGRVLLEQLMWRPGQFLTVDDLLEKPALASFDRPDARAVCVTRLLTAFGEDRERPWFFELVYHPWRIRWNPERSWRIIEQLAR